MLSDYFKDLLAETNLLNRNLSLGNIKTIDPKSIVSVNERLLPFATVRTDGAAASAC